MPYIVTTKRRDVFDVNGPEHDVWTVLSRRAVATLDDAQAFVSGLIEGMMPWPSQPDATRAAADQLWKLPESGGTVGPLPDGTTIEVERVRWGELREAVLLARTALEGPLERWPGDGGQPILDAFNAREQS